MKEIFYLIKDFYCSLTRFIANFCFNRFLHVIEILNECNSTLESSILLKCFIAGKHRLRINAKYIYVDQSVRITFILNVCFELNFTGIYL